MEWTWREQMVLLIQCGGFGMVIGIVYDSVSVWQRFRRYSHGRVFVSDCVFCLLAALMTFFFSLATMDGRMHPLLFVGMGIGVLAERCGIGRVYRCLLYRFLMLIRLAWRCLLRALRVAAARCRRFGDRIYIKTQKTLGKLKKIRKKSCNPTPKPLK